MTGGAESLARVEPERVLLTVMKGTILNSEPSRSATGFEGKLRIARPQ